MIVNVRLLSRAAVGLMCSVLAVGCGGGTPPTQKSSSAAGTAGTSFNVIVNQPVGGTISSGADGKISCGTTGTKCDEVSYPWTTSVTLTATPDAGFKFVGWFGDCTGSGTCTLDTTRTGADKYALAAFLPDAQYSGMYYFVTVQRPTQGTVTSPDGQIRCGTATNANACGPAVYPWAETATLTATGDANFGFDGWSGDCSGAGTCPLSTATRGTDKSVNAMFSARPPQSCPIANGTGTETFDPSTNTYGPCVVTGCDAGYKIANGACVPASFYVGALPATLPGSSSNSFGSMAFDGSGNLLIVVGGSPNKLYEVNRQTGALTTYSPALPQNWFVSLAVDAVTGLAYIGSGNDGSIYSYSRATSVTTLVASISAYSINGLAIAPTGFGAYGGKLIASTYGGVIYAIDRTTGASTQIAVAPYVTSGIAFGSSDALYLACPNNGGILKVTGNGTVSIFRSWQSAPDGLAVDVTRNRLYIADPMNAAIWIADLATGALTRVPGAYAFDGGWWPSPIAYDGVSNVLYIADPGSPSRLSAVAP